MLSSHSDPHATEASAALRLGIVGVTFSVVGTQLAVGAWLASLLQLPRRAVPTAEALDLHV